MKKKLILKIFLLIIVIIFSGCTFFRPEEKEKLAPPLEKPPETDYDLVKVERKDITDYVKGRRARLVSGAEEPLFYTKSDQRIEKINVSYGDKVEAGDVLAQLAIGDLENRIEQQKLEVERLKLILNDLKNNSTKEIRKTDWLITKLRLDHLKKEYERAKSLKNALSQSELENLENKVKIQELELKKARLNLESHFASEVEKAKLNLKQAKLELDNLKEKLADSRLRAPVDGKITYIDNIEEGDFITAYETLFIVSPDSKLQVYFETSKADSITPGMPADIKYDGEYYQGEVVFSTSRRVEDSRWRGEEYVVVESDQLPAEASIGDIVEVEVELETTEDTLVLPKNAVDDFRNQNFVEVLDDKGMKKRINVQTGIETETEVEILEGVEEGRKVIAE